ncbi:MAG: SpoIIE family protein phosphatase [Terriglobales bacterium]
MPQLDIWTKCLYPERGDTLLLFTDRVVEACNAREEAFGEDRLLQITRKSANSLRTPFTMLCCRLCPIIAADNFKMMQP